MQLNYSIMRESRYGDPAVGDLDALSQILPPPRHAVVRMPLGMLEDRHVVHGGHDRRRIRLGRARLDKVARLEKCRIFPTSPLTRNCPLVKLLAAHVGQWRHSPAEALAIAGAVEQTQANLRGLKLHRGRLAAIMLLPLLAEAHQFQSAVAGPVIKH